MLTYISNIAHYLEVLSRVPNIKHNLWIGTADIKDLYVEDGQLFPRYFFFQTRLLPFFFPFCIRVNQSKRL